MFADLYDYLYHQNATGGIPLKGTGIVLGLALLLSHLWAWKNSARAQAFLLAFPRAFHWGVILLTIDMLWSVFALAQMDMGEFYNVRRVFILVTVAGYVGVVMHVREFLAVRALGALMLLAAGPVLTAAFLQPQTSRLLIPVLAYAWIIAGMYFIGMPYLMRDAAQWFTARQGRWNAAMFAGIGYGALLLGAAVVLW